MPSFVDFYVLIELFKDVDGWFSFDVFSFISKTGATYAGPVLGYGPSAEAMCRIKLTEDKYRASAICPVRHRLRDSADGIWMRFGWLEF